MEIRARRDGSTQLTLFLAVVFLLLPGGLRAQDPPLPNTLVAAHYDDFSLGVNDTVFPLELPPGQSPNAFNIVVDEPQGSFKPRNGFTQCGILPSGNAARSLYEYERSDGSRRLIVSDNATVYETSDCTTWTTIVTGLSSTERTYFKTVRDKLWFVNRSTWAQTWDGTTRIPLDGRANTPVPTVPQFNYLEYWQSRVWGARTEAHPAGIFFSALTETTAGNDLDPSTGTLAWPAANLIQVNRQSGGPIYGIKVYGNRLYAFKESEIWNIDFQSEFDFSIIKTQSNVGTLYQESIKEKDGYLYFSGRDGIYKFDGNRSVRISDNILNLYGRINQATSNLQRKSWSVAGDFDDGTFNSTTEISVAGSISLSSGVVEDNFSDGNFTAGPRWANGGNWTISSGEAVNSVGSGVMSTEMSFSTGAFQFRARAYPTSGNNVEVKFVSADNTLATGDGYSLQLEHGGSNDVNVFLRRWSGGSATTIGTKGGHLTENGADNLNTYRVNRTTAGIFTVSEAGAVLFTVTDTQVAVTSSAVVNCGSGNCGFDDMNFWYYVTSGTWTSEDYSAVTVTTWSTYGAESTANSGTVGYEVRVATNSGGLSAASYSAITPGALINGTSNQIRVQTRVTLTGNVADKSVTPSAEIVTVNWYRGGSPTQIIDLGVWKNRLWVSASTGTSDTANVVLISNKYDDTSWVPHSLSIGPMTSYSGNFYAASSTHSGVNRMDYGTSDNGAAIPWFWNSPDEGFGAIYNYKRLLEMQASFRRDSADSAFMGWSTDSGVTISSRTINMSGSGYGTSRQFLPGDRSKSFRMSVGSSALDEVAVINRVSAYSKIEKFRD